MLFNMMWTENIDLLKDIFKMQTPLGTKHSEICVCERERVCLF